MRQKLHNAFTLIEMMVVITIIVILVALLFPALRVVEERANKTKCLNNCKQIAVAAQTLFGELGDKLPYRSDWMKWGEAADSLLPYVKFVEDVFDCPANPGNQDYPDCKMASGRFTDYEINGLLCTYGKVLWRQQNMINDYSLAAYAYDYRYTPADNRSHEGGVNCAYLDGHAAWLKNEDMHLEGGPECFYNKGHDFWK